VNKVIAAICNCIESGKILSSSGLASPRPKASDLGKVQIKLKLNEHQEFLKALDKRDPTPPPRSYGPDDDYPADCEISITLDTAPEYSDPLP
jgi:hypothetical protein